MRSPCLIPYLRTAALLVLAACSLGLFPIETPEEEQKRAQDHLKAVSKYYDLASLRLFLRAEIRERRTCDGADLTQSKIGTEWVASAGGPVCGDWQMTLFVPPSDDFQLNWCYRITRRQDGGYIFSRVVFDCVRVSRSRFQVTRVHLEDVRSISVS